MVTHKLAIVSYFNLIIALASPGIAAQWQEKGVRGRSWTDIDKDLAPRTSTECCTAKQIPVCIDLRCNPLVYAPGVGKEES